MDKDGLAQMIYGFKRTSSSHCVCHNAPQSLDTFRDEISVKEFMISGLCQESQDSVFNGEWADEEEEELAEA
jgi:hypothetical protein